MRGILVPPRTIRRAWEELAKEIWATDPSVPWPSQTRWIIFRIFSRFAAAFGLWIVGILLALVWALVTIGVYSVIAYSTARRTP